MTNPPTPEPAAVQPLGPDDFLKWYGGWDPLTPATIGDFMAGFDRPWWVIGGWSVEVVTGVHREHEDMDVSMLAPDAPAFREFLAGRWTAWNVDESWFRPFDERFPDVRPDSQLWVRRDARSSWVLDVPLTPSTDGRWSYKRDPGLTAELDEVTWVAPDGLRYQRPEVTMLFKARQSRPKDVADAKAVLPLLDAPARRWLREALARSEPAHPWVRELA